MTSGGKERTLWVKQVKSGICCNRKQKATLRALGLEKLGRVRAFPDNREVRAMVASIPHLVQIVPGPDPAAGER